MSIVMVFLIWFWVMALSVISGNWDIVVAGILAPAGFGAAWWYEKRYGVLKNR